jgi:hypothetical protein
MRFLVRAEMEMAAGDAMDRSGGPGAVFAHLAARFRPEVMYVSAVKRETIFVVELDGPGDLAELAHFLQFLTLANAEFTPVLTGSEAMDQLPAAVERALAAV